MYEYVFRYAQRSIWDALCSRTLYPSRAVLLDQLLAHSDVIDETRSHELAQHPKLLNVKFRMVILAVNLFAAFLLYLNVTWRGQLGGEAGVGVGEIGADDVTDLRS